MHLSTQNVCFHKKIIRKLIFNQASYLEVLIQDYGSLITDSEITGFTEHDVVLSVTGI